MSKRLDRLLPGLSAKERAILTLRDYKADKPQDRRLLQTAPESQTGELNRLIGMMNAANGDLAHLLLVIRERVRLDELRLGWLQWARMCALDLWAARAHFLMSGKEPTTESAYRQREAAARSDLLSLEACATIYTEDYHVWDAADYEMDEDGDQVPIDGAWYRVRDQKRAELEALVDAGSLSATGKGKRRKVSCGAFYDWLGKPVPVAPDFGGEFDVQPDCREREVARARHDHEFMQRLLDRGACKLELPLDMESPLNVEPPGGKFNVELARVVAATIRACVRENWRQLRAIEAQIDAITEAFDGEDVLHERPRAYLDEAKATLNEVRETLQEYTGAFELPDPDEYLRATMQRIVDYEVAHVPMR